MYVYRKMARNRGARRPRRHLLLELAPGMLRSYPRAQLRSRTV